MSPSTNSENSNSTGLAGGGGILNILKARKRWWSSQKSNKKARESSSAGACSLAGFSTLLPLRAFFGEHLAILVFFHFLNIVNYLKQLELVHGETRSSTVRFPARGISMLVHLTGLASFSASFLYLRLDPSPYSTTFGGDFQFLTIIGLSLAQITFLVALISDLTQSHTLFEIKNLLSLCSTPLEVLVNVLYWSLYAIDKRLMVLMVSVIFRLFQTSCFTVCRLLCSL